MKKAFFAAVCLLCLFSCAQDIKHKDNMSLAVGGPGIDYTTDWAWVGLLGNPREVKYSDGTVYRFDPKGNSFDVSFSTKKFNGHSRTDFRAGGTGQSKYDNLGRLVQFTQISNEFVYTYEGDAYYPASKKEVHRDSLSKATVQDITYSYDPKDFDAHGNWLSRKENGQTVTRTISYHLDPYFVSIHDQYMSPKALAKVFYESEINGDAERALSTFDPKVRKNKSLTVHRRKTLYKAQDEDKTRIVHYSIKNVQTEKKGDKEIAFVTVNVKNAAGRSYLETIRCYKQKDGSWLRDEFILNE